jgi:hypothetical protein
VQNEFEDATTPYDGQTQGIQIGYMTSIYKCTRQAYRILERASQGCVDANPFRMQILPYNLATGN